jgi:hypothetical protein
MLSMTRALVAVACCVLAMEARAACTPEQVQALRRSNLTEEQIRSACADRRTSNRCYSPAANCILDEPKSAGSSCWCPTPFGASHGRVR